MAPAHDSPESLPPAQLLYDDLDTELALTRAFLQRYPDGRGDWRPHEKSMTLTRLATHVAELPNLGAAMLEADELDFAKRPYAPHLLDTAAELVAVFDTKADAARRAIGSADFAALARNWTLRQGDRVILSAPKKGLVRRLLISHLVHHRAQLGVYYRMLDVALPPSYGPSADESI